jgi:hypothetical protein
MQASYGDDGFPSDSSSHAREDPRTDGTGGGARRSSRLAEPAQADNRFAFGDPHDQEREFSG